MKLVLALSILLCFCANVFSQHTLSLSIKSHEEKLPLAGTTVTITSINKTGFADSLGTVLFNNLAEGPYLLLISHVGFEDEQINVTVPATISVIEVFLKEGEEEEEEHVIVTATRTSRTIGDIPTRVETISGEELAEKGNMKPGDIRLLLNESTGIQTQQTSATSYNSSIRIQGLDGRYTQILRDGFPLYSGFAAGLSLMQVAPLDLKQIEVIKGSSSTLYGGGAIAGLVNLVSKTPTAKKELSFMANATTAGGLDLSGFYSQKFNRVGLTLFGSRNSNKAFDPAGIKLTAIPKFERYTINPRLFIYGERTNADVGFSYITEDRVGGSIDYIKNGTSGYFENNNTDRFTTQAHLTRQVNEHSKLDFKNSYSGFHRLIQIPAYAFKGLQQSTYSEATYSVNKEKGDWIIGANLLTDDFKEEKQTTAVVRNYHYNTFGVFVQNTWTLTKQFALETGLRSDYVKQYGIELLPRISAMFKMSPKLTARIGGGLGYKTPSLFNEETEKMHFQNLLPFDEHVASNERSAGGNVDVNYRTRVGNVSIAFNHLFFLTKLNKPLVLANTGTNDFEFTNAQGHIDTKGMETNIRLAYGGFKLFVGYTYANVNTHFNDVEAWYPLTAKHRLNNVLIYEKEGKLKIGAEAYYYSRQKLNDGAEGKAYWLLGLMGEKIWDQFSLFVNFENISDVRQTKFDTIYSGTITSPVFRDIYAPVDGFVVNGGIKIRL